MKKVGVVILNYLNYEDTIECVESLQKDSYENKEVIVVDNASENNSVQYLRGYIEDHNLDVHLLANDKNEGFARGNNVGILFARKNLRCEFVLLVNNDTVFVDHHMIRSLLLKYQKGIGIIGPRIISRNGYEQNPAVEKFSCEDIIPTKKRTWKSWIKKLLQAMGTLNGYLRMVTFIQRQKQIIRNKIFPTRVGDHMVLHGSCMLLTPDYFFYYSCLYPATFLYYEEVILMILLSKVGLNSLFTSTGYIIHKEDQSSLLSFNNDRKIMNQYEQESRKMADDLKRLKYEEIKNRFEFSR